MKQTLLSFLSIFIMNFASGETIKVKIFYDDNEVAEFPSERYEGYEQSKIWIEGFRVGKDSDINIEVEEDGLSLSENAQQKAVEISKYTNMYVLASDGGVDIPSLGDKWDILRN